MNTRTSTLSNYFPANEDSRSEQAMRETRLTAGLCVFAGLAIATGLGGLGIGTASIFHLIDSHSWTALAGTVLLCSAFPLMILAAHCMDKLGEVRKAARIDYCRKNGMR